MIIIILRSGTVNIEGIDDDDLSLSTVGEFGIGLSSQNTCFRWLSRELSGRGRGRINCRTSCAPTYWLARRTLIARGTWYLLRRYYKRVSGLFYSYYTYCVFSRDRWFWSSHVECCYDILFGYLVENPYAGAGRSHAYHPYINYFNYLEEENAYQDCCFRLSLSRRFFCAWFNYLRPVCSSRFWYLDRPYWGRNVCYYAGTAFNRLIKIGKFKLHSNKNTLI